MATSSWLIGSFNLTTAFIQVNGVNVSVPGGNLYLRSAVAVLSLIDIVETAIQTEVPTATLFLTEGRTVRLLPTGGNPVEIDWLSNLTLRDALGYAANLASQDTPHDAPNVSPLLFSPGFTATPETLLDTSGYVTNDQSRMASADGTELQVTTFFEQVQQRLSWTHILAERMRVANSVDGGGTFFEFHEQSSKLGFSMRYYQEQTEVASSTTAVTWDDSVDNSHGPYILKRTMPRAYSRVVRNADLYSTLTMGLAVVAEYS